MGRTSTIKRVTNETDIELSIDLDGIGRVEIDTGIGFFDHMLEGFARHGLFDLKVVCKGDLHVDSHHTIEDVGIVLGQAISEAVGEKEGLKRYGSAILPMDEALVLCALDLSGRPYFACDAQFTTERLGTFETEMVYDFFYAISYSAKMNLHIKLFSGTNNHHIAEAAFKSFAKALDNATLFDSRIEGVLSTKGTL